MKIQVLGSGCPTCKSLYKNVQEAVQTLGLTTEVEYSTDTAAIVRLGAMRSPVLAIDGRIAVAGRVPSKSEIATLLADRASGQQREISPPAPGGCSCGGPACSGEAGGARDAAKQLTIVWRRLLQEAETCPRCASTEGELAQAVAELTARLGPQKIEVVVQKEAITTEEFQRDPTRSNAILFNGRPLEALLQAKTGTSGCCGVCGDAACRTVETASASYEVIPAALIVEAGMAAVAGADR